MYLRRGIPGITMLALVAMSASSAQAALLITATEQGSQVTFSYAGTLNVDGLEFDDDVTYLVGINPSFGTINFGAIPGSQANPNAGDGYYPVFASGPTNFGTGGGVFGSPAVLSTSGDSFRLLAGSNEIAVPVGFSSGFLSGEFTVLGTFASLSMDNSQSYSWILDNATADTITLQFTPTAIPEPLTILGAGVAIGLGMRFKRR